jgi:hypothetical protein
MKQTHSEGDTVVKLHHTAVIVLSVLDQVIKGLWYAALGTPWAAAVGKSQAQLDDPGATAYVVSLVAALVSNYMLAGLISRLGLRTALQGLLLGASTWFCFSASVLAVHYSFALLHPTMLIVDAGSDLVTLALAGAVLATWHRRGSTIA